MKKKKKQTKNSDVDLMLICPNGLEDAFEKDVNKIINSMQKGGIESLSIKDLNKIAKEKIALDTLRPVLEIDAQLPLVFLKKDLITFQSIDFYFVLIIRYHH